MFDFFISDQTLPFGIAAATLLGLSAIELLGLLLMGAGISHLLDGLLSHDSDAGHVATASPDALSGLGEQLLGWLHWGKVPLLAILSIYLAGFAVSGYATQWLALGVSGHTLPVLLASVPAVIGGLFAVRKLALPLAALMPRDETSVIKLESLIGFEGRVTLGTASRGSPVEVAVRDLHGVTHYIYAEPESDAERIEEGSLVTLVSKPDNSFRVSRSAKVVSAATTASAVIIERK